MTQLSSNVKALIGKFVFVLVMSYLGSLQLAHGLTLNCLNNQSQILPIDDQQVLKNKVSTPNQFLARAHIQGLIGNVYPDHSGHNHFELRIGPGSQDTIEVVYNQSFGALPLLQSGMQVEACGDFITSNRATSQYPASPDGAILHWVHKSPGGHASGFIAINGVYYVQQGGNGGASTF